MVKLDASIYGAGVLSFFIPITLYIFYCYCEYNDRKMVRQIRKSKRGKKQRLASSLHNGYQNNSSNGYIPVTPVIYSTPDAIIMSSSEEKTEKFSQTSV